MTELPRNSNSRPEDVFSAQVAEFVGSIPDGTLIEDVAKLQGMLAEVPGAVSTIEDTTREVRWRIHLVEQGGRVDQAAASLKEKAKSGHMTYESADYRTASLYGEDGVAFMSAAGKVLYADVGFLHRPGTDVRNTVTHYSKTGVILQPQASDKLDEYVAFAETDDRGPNEIAGDGITITLPGPIAYEDSIQEWCEPQERESESTRADTLRHMVAVVSRPGADGGIERVVYYPLEALRPQTWTEMERLRPPERRPSYPDDTGALGVKTYPGRQNHSKAPIHAISGAGEQHDPEPDREPTSPPSGRLVREILSTRTNNDSLKARMALANQFTAMIREGLGFSGPEHSAVVALYDTLSANVDKVSYPERAAFEEAFRSLGQAIGNIQIDSSAQDRYFARESGTQRSGRAPTAYRHGVQLSGQDRPSAVSARRGSLRRLATSARRRFTRER